MLNLWFARLNAVCFTYMIGKYFYVEDTSFMYVVLGVLNYMVMVRSWMNYQRFAKGLNGLH